MIKVIGVLVAMALVAGTMHYFGMGSQIEVQVINGVPTNVLVN